MAQEEIMNQPIEDKERLLWLHKKPSQTKGMIGCGHNFKLLKLLQVDTHAFTS